MRTGSFQAHDISPGTLLYDSFWTFSMARKQVPVAVGSRAQGHLRCNWQRIWMISGSKTLSANESSLYTSFLRSGSQSLNLLNSTISTLGSDDARKWSLHLGF